MGKYTTTHLNPKGPGDARPTALQILKDEGLVGKLSGKTFLVTGANQGIGLETARVLHAAGATTFVTARDSTKVKQAISGVLAGKDAQSEAPVFGIELRLDSLSSVRAAAKEFLAQNNSLNVLILNAGVMATPEGKTEDGFETQFGTNHLGHFLLFQLLKPALLTGTSSTFQSRVVSVASLAHRMSGIRFHDFNFNKDPYDPWLAYGQSKTANIYLANEIERLYGSQGLHGLSVHPGMVATNLNQHIEMDSMDTSEGLKNTIKSIPQGAATTVYAAISKEWEGRGGKYLSNCTEELPASADADLMSGEGGHAAWAYDEQAAERLWKDSCKLVGIDGE